MAAAIKAVASKSHEEAPDMLVVSTILNRQEERAARLERDCTAAIAVADVVIDELVAANAKGLEPGLQPHARKMGGFR